MLQEILLFGVQDASKIFCVATAQKALSGSETDDSFGLLFHDEPGRRAYRIFTKFRTPDFHETSCMELIQSYEIIIRMVDSFLPAALSVRKSGLVLSNENLFLDANYTTRLIENTVTPG